MPATARTDPAAWQRVAGALHRRRAADHRPVCAYVYDLPTLREQARRVRSALPPWCRVYYAVKANSHPAVVRTVAPLLDGFEIASLGELWRVRRALAGTGLDGDVRFVFSGPGKTDADLEGALRAGVELVNVEGITELRRLAAIAQRAGVRAPVALRVNPRTVLLGGSHRMTGTPSQFGIDERRLPEAIALLRKLPTLELRGLHLHAVSNNLDVAAHARFVQRCLDTAERVEDAEGVPLPLVDVGGGFGVDYRGGASFDIDAFAARLAGPPPGRTVLLEPGRLIVAGCGYYAAEVLDVKENHGRHFAVVRGGVHHFRLPSTPHAPEHGHPCTVLPVEEWRYPFPRPEARDVPVTVAGELCTPRDVLALDVPVGRLRCGDLVVFPLAGAYGWEISHHDFLAHPHPDHLVVE